MFRKLRITLTALFALASLSSGAQSAPLILNEYNAVDDDLLLEEPTAADVFWGRRPGNGGDWFEVVVVNDHLDVRSWELVVSNDTGGAAQETFLVKLSNHLVWSNLRSGTIITFSEDLKNNVADYQPEAGRWWINVHVAPDIGGTYATVSCLAPACSPSAVNWKVSNNNWQLTVRNSVGTTVFGPAGEGISPATGVGSTEVCKLEESPTATITPLSSYRDGTSSTFGQPNRYAAGTLMQNFDTLRSVVPYSPLTDVRINELATHSDPGTDWIELRNMTDQPIDIGGWFLSDSFSLLTKYEFPPDTVVAPFGHLVVDETTLGFAFSAPCGERAILSEGNGVVPTGPRDFVEFGPMETGVTLGRYPDGTGSLMRLADPTPGNDNSPPAIGPVVINEIMYHPPDPNPPSTLDAEFVELRNRSAQPVTLATDFGAGGVRPWKLTGGVDFTFSTSTVIPANGYLVVVGFDPVANPAELADFRTYYGIGAGVAVVGPYSGRLDNFSDTLRLRKPDTPEANGDICGGTGNPSPYVPAVIVDEVTYFDFGDWPTEADGLGPSLERVDGHAFGDRAANWVANLAYVATPGGANSVHGPATRAQQKCLNGSNKAFAKVQKAEARAAYDCIRNGVAGRLPAGVDMDVCLELDVAGRVARAQLSTTSTRAKVCTGVTDLAPNAGFYGPSDAAPVNEAGAAVFPAVLRDLYGGDLDAAILAGDSTGLACQLAVTRVASKCVDIEIRTFNTCKKKSLASALVAESADLEACVGDDPVGKVAAACNAVSGKIGATVTASCAAVSLAAALPGCGSASIAGAAACIERAAACRACLALNAADNLLKDCDLVDDGIDDDSCP